MLREKLELDGKAFTSVAAPLFAYLFHRINQKAFVEYVGDKELTNRILDICKDDGYILKNCKLYAWAWYKHTQGFGDKPKCREYGVSLSDGAFLRRLNLSHLALRFETVSLPDFDRLLEDTLFSSAMKQHIGKLISKKMLFLVRSYGVKREELEQTLMEAALYALYKQYPRYESILHFTNVAKTTIHNTAMSLISYYTCPSRQCLVRDKNGDFQAVHEQLDTAANKMEASDEYMHHVKDDLETIVRLSPKMKPRVQRFLMACAGHLDEEFSKFLGEDNSVAIDAMAYSRYLTKARKFFGLTEENVDRVFGRLRYHLT